MRILNPLLLLLVVAGCARAPLPFEESAIQDASASEPRHERHDGKMIGALGGATGGAVLAYSSAGLLCTIGGPLCAIVVVPAMVVGGVAGGAAGSVVDAANSPRVEPDAARAPGSTAGTAPPLADTSIPRGG